MGDEYDKLYGPGDIMLYGIHKVYICGSYALLFGDSRTSKYTTLRDPDFNQYHIAYEDGSSVAWIPVGDLTPIEIRCPKDYLKLRYNSILRKE